MANHKDAVIYKDEEINFMWSSNPITKGHAIIATQKSYSDLDEVPQKLLDKVLELTQCYVRLLKNNFSFEGYSIVHHGGQFNELECFQLHILPRNNEQEFVWTYSDTVDEEATMLDSLKQLLQEEFQRLYSS